MAHVVLNRAEAEGRAKAIGKKLVDPGLPRSEQIGLFSVLLGKPPSMRGDNDALFHTRIHLNLHGALPEHVLDDHPSAVNHAVLLRRLRVYLGPRPRIYLAE